MASAEADAGVRQALNHDRIVRAAIDLIEKAGVDALSMRRVAAELGVAAMSLYYHVPNKAALLDAVADRIVAGLDIADDLAGEATGDIRERARSLMRAFRRIAHDHPRCVSLILTRSADSPASRRLMEQTLGIARAAGYEGVIAARVALAFFSYVLGSLTREAGTAKALKHLPAGTDLGRFLGLFDPAHYPHLATLAVSGLAMDPEAEFEFGMEMLIRGLPQQG
jgi:AcrR family transcriptional regulator